MPNKRNTQPSAGNECSIALIHYVSYLGLDASGRSCAGGRLGEDSSSDDLFISDLAHCDGAWELVNLAPARLKSRQRKRRRMAQSGIVGHHPSEELSC